MSISPPFAAAVGWAVAAGVIGSVYAHRAEDSVEGALIRNEQEESVQTLHRLLEVKFGLYAKDRRIGLGRVIAQRTERVAGITRRQRRRRQHEAHFQKLAQRRQIRAGENVARFLEGRLLELSEAL